MPYPGIIRPPRIGLPKGKLRDNLVFAVAPRDHLGFYQGGNPPVEHAGSYGVNEYGPAFRAAAAADRLEYRRPEDFASRINAANETTIFVLASMDLTSSDAWAMFLMAHSNDDSHVSPFGDLGFHRNGSTSAGMIHYNHGGFTQIASASGFIVDDELHAYAVTKDSGGNATFYRDGAEHSTGSSGNVMQLTTTATTIIISERNRTDTGHGAVGDFNVGYVFDRALTAEEIAELSGDPFGPLRVQRMPVFLPATQVEGGTSVTPNDTSQSQTSETPALTQIHDLTATDTAQSQASETPTLTQVHSLTANDTSQSQSTESPALTQVHALSPSETSQSQASDTPTLTQVHDLSPQETSQAQAAETPTITVEGAVSPESTSQSQSTETPALTQVHGLSPTDTSQSQASETPDLSQVHGLSPNETSQSQASENPSINVFAGLTPLDTSQSQTSETPALSQTHSVAPDGTLQVQTSENPALSISGSFAFGSGTPTSSKAVSGTPSGDKVTGTPTASRAVTGEPA